MSVVALVEAFVDGEGLRQTLEASTVVAGFRLIGVWLRRNRIALELDRGRRRT